MALECVRAKTLAERAGAYYVRIQAMAVRHSIPLRDEFDEHDAPDTKYIVLLDGVLPVATCSLYPVDNARIMLGRVVVLPEYRGRGLGRRAVTEAENWARELGYAIARLESRVDKTGFYEKLGYAFTGEAPVKGVTFECVAMEKSLTAGSDE